MKGKVAIILVAVICFSSIGFGIYSIWDLYPDNQGHNRTVLFVQTSGNRGYYIIDDEIYTPNNRQSDLYYYGFGNRTIIGSSVEWQVDDKVVNYSVLYPKVQIEPIQSKVYRDDTINFTTNGVKITPTTTGDVRIISLLSISYHNESRIQVLPLQPSDFTSQIQGNAIGWVINGSDFFIIPQSGSDVPILRGTRQKIPQMVSTFEIQGITTECHRLFFQKDGSSVSEIYCHGVSLHYGDKSFTYQAEKKLIPFVWNMGDSIRVFENDEDAYIPQKQNTQSSAPPSTSVLSHPYLYLNNSGKLALLDKIADPASGPWADYYSKISSIQHATVLDKAIKAYLDDNATWADSAIIDILNISHFEPFRQNLERGSKLADYMVAYDFLYNFMDAEQRQQFERDAFRLTYPSADALIHNVMPLNNHKVVSLISYGLLGLVTHNASMVRLMQDQIDSYLSDEIIRGGICYEGPSYADYTFRYATRFMFALKNAGGYNYFLDPNYIDFLNNTVLTRSPDGTHPLFEDTHEGIQMVTLILRSIGEVENKYPSLASNLRWYVESAGGYGSVWDGGFAFPMLTLPQMDNGTAAALPFSGSYIYFDGGYAGLGTGNLHNDTMLVISNKAYYQSHAHYDENSVELWAMGQKILTNAGYPHYGHVGHGDTVKTSGNNAVEIGGHPQYLIESDGFAYFIASSQLRVIDSPCFLAYEHPLSFSHFPWVQIFLILAALGLGIVVLTIRDQKKPNKIGVVIPRWQIHAQMEIPTLTATHEAPSEPPVLKFPWGLFIGSIGLHSIGFLAVIYRAHPYLSKAIEHIEAWPEAKATFQASLNYTLIGLSFCTFLVSLILHLRLKRLAAHNLDTPIDKMISYRSVFSQTLIFYCIWALLINWLGYDAFYRLQIGFFTEGSTVANAVVQVIGLMKVIWLIWLICIILRLILLGFYINSDRIVRYYLIRDFIRIIVFFGAILSAIYFLQQVPIEFAQQF